VLRALDLQRSWLLLPRLRLLPELLRLLLHLLLRLLVLPLMLHLLLLLVFWLCLVALLFSCCKWSMRRGSSRITIPREEKTQ
jgi:hypothetical protein